MSCDQNMTDPQQQTVHGVAFTQSKGVGHWSPIFTKQDQTNASWVTFLMVFPNYLVVNFTAWITFSEHIFAYKYTWKYTLLEIYVHHAYVWLSTENYIFATFSLPCTGNTYEADESVLWHGQNHDESIKWTSQGTFESHRYFRDT